MGIYAFSDLHGCYDLWAKIRDRITPEDTVYCLGDNIDRGSRGYDICHEQMQMSNVIVLKGNHEDMAAAAIPFLLRGIHYRTVRQWYMNGGEATWKNLENRSEEEIRAFSWWCNSLPINIAITNANGQTIHLDHAGFTPGRELAADPLWDRAHFSDPWPADQPNVFLVHGHTPVHYLVLQYFNAKERQAVQKYIHLDKDYNFIPHTIPYCDGHKFDIDLGCVASNRAALLNLDTFETIYIE